MFTSIRASKAIILALLLALSMVFAVATAAAEPETEYENGALTPPPPVTGDEQKLIRYPAQDSMSGVPTPFSFDPSHIYLEDGNNLLTDLHNGTVDVSGSTSATVSAQTIGFQLTLQRWTGSAWVNHDVSGYYVNNYSSYHSGSKIVSITKGYYYRIVSYHYVDHLGIYESGSVTSPHTLVS